MNDEIMELFPRYDTDALEIVISVIDTNILSITSVMSLIADGCSDVSVIIVEECLTHTHINVTDIIYDIRTFMDPLFEEHCDPAIAENMAVIVDMLLYHPTSELSLNMMIYIMNKDPELFQDRYNSSTGEERKSIYNDLLAVVLACPEGGRAILCDHNDAQPEAI